MKAGKPPPATLSEFGVAAHPDAKSDPAGHSIQSSAVAETTVFGGRCAWACSSSCSSLPAPPSGSSLQRPPDSLVAAWHRYGGDAGSNRYSPLTQIDKSDVGELTIAREYHTGEVSDGTAGEPRAHSKRRRSSHSARCT